uniref:Uncharacterized protein n=1 Tax=viral metagenome TaxID=1070528 RepID=A0A6C0JUV3_9ZZZZ
MASDSQAKRFCKCIKAVRKTVKVRRGSTKEQAAIAICTKTILQSRGRTLKRFSCKKGPKLKTQKALSV